MAIIDNSTNGLPVSTDRRFTFYSFYYMLMLKIINNEREDIMSKATMGQIIANARKKQNLTQKQLAEQMGVTDKAVSKWERDLSCPDVNSLAELAKVLDISVEQLLKCESRPSANKKTDLADTILLAVALAMGVCTVVIAVLNEITAESAGTLLGIGVFCLSLYLLKNRDKFSA